MEDRNIALKSDLEARINQIRELEVGNEAKIAEIDSLRDLNNELKFEVARKSEQIASAGSVILPMSGGTGKKPLLLVATRPTSGLGFVQGGHVTGNLTT